MKKLIAISVLLALVAGAVFADLTIGGQLQIGNNILSGDGKYEAYTTKDGLTEYRAKDPTVSATAWENGKIKLNFGDDVAGGQYGIEAKGSSVGSWGFMYWRFIPQVKLQVGRDPDGQFGHDQISGWGFTAEAKNSVGALNDYGGAVSSLSSSGGPTSGVWYGGTGDRANVSLSIFPIDGLTINLFVPTGSNEVYGFRYARFEASVAYAIEGVGTVRVAYKSDTGFVKAKADSWWKTEQQGTPTAYAAFHFTGVPGLGAELGVAYHFPLIREYDIEGLGKTKYTRDYPVATALGVAFNSGDFGIKARLGGSFGGSATEKEFNDPKVETKDDVKYGINILPSYKIGATTIYLFSGLGFQTTQAEAKNGLKSYEVAGGIYATNESDTVVDWFVNPYVSISAGSLTFYAGVQFWSDGVKKGNGKVDNNGKPNKDAVVQWGIPFGFNCYF